MSRAHRAIDAGYGSTPLMTPGVRRRANNREESLLRQGALPGRDFELRAKGRRRLVNPNSGCELNDARRHGAMFPYYLRAPDRALWEAAGFHYPRDRADGRIQ